MLSITRRPLLACGALAALLTAPAPSARAAEPFPTRPIRVIVTSAAGGWIDVTTRVVAQRMTEILGQQVMVENRTGAGALSRCVP